MNPCCGCLADFSEHIRLGISQIFRPTTVGVGAGAACDLLAVLEIAENQDQKIAACGSSYKGIAYARKQADCQAAFASNRTSTACSYRRRRSWRRLRSFKAHTVNARKNATSTSSANHPGGNSRRSSYCPLTAAAPVSMRAFSRSSETGNARRSAAVPGLSDRPDQYRHA
ncbi:hypothetical protein PS723_00110 [Pseudomonas fluorescens]|uniref:Uncharacterized protein n=1 Tax=Pseudomonas fluorescens TaxID=294 RepID=A0A5E6ZIA7_PSEFL|nr:hypothetical protein PS723_00110 [Pseudomonas fluorescens]